MKKFVFSIAFLSLLIIHSLSFTQKEVRSSKLHQIAQAGLHLFSIISGVYVSGHAIGTLLTMGKMEYYTEQFRQDIKEEYSWLSENEIDAIIKLYRKATFQIISFSTAATIVPMPLIVYGMNGLAEDINKFNSKKIREINIKDHTN